MTSRNRSFSRLWLLPLLTILLGVASTAAVPAAKSSSSSAVVDSTATNTRTLQQEGIPRATHDYVLDSTLVLLPMLPQDNKERKLLLVDIQESFHQLFSTPPEAWTAAQWMLALIMILLLLWCCGGCLAGGGRRRRHYYYSSSSSGMWKCLRNVFCCVCCFEWCCRDCQDVPCCNGSGTGAAAGGEYYRQTGDGLI